MNVPNEPNEPAEGQFGISLPEGFVPDEPETGPEPSAEEPPAAESPEPPPVGELPPSEPPIVRHDPFAHIRTAPWMNRALDASGRAAAFLRRLLQDFAAIEGRQPNRADLDDIVKRTTDYMIPIFKRERATDAAYDELEKRRAARLRTAQALSTTAPAAAGGLGGAVPSRAAAARMAPIVARVAGGPVGGLASIVLPTNFEGESIMLGDGLRARRRVGQNSIEIERQAHNGLLDTGIGAEWGKLPVAAQFWRDESGRRVLQIDVVQLERAIGKPAADRLLGQSGIAGDGLNGRAKKLHDAMVRRRADGVPAGPGGVEPPPGFLPILEMRLTSSVDGGVTVSHAEILDENAKRYCPSYPLVLEVGMRAGTAVDVLGLPGGPERGRLIHQHAAAELKTAQIEKELRARGMQEIHVERGFLGGELKRGFLKSGSSRIDVVEKIGDDSVCIYDFKTGGATFPDRVRERYLREMAMYYGVRNIYVLPVYVP
jgi:hypothetical protein